MNKQLMFSSATSEWETDPALIKNLSIYFDWDLDVCASRPNVCENYYSKENSAFDNVWRGLCWMNPVYGNSEQPCKPNCSKERCKKRGWHTDVYLPGIPDFIRQAWFFGKIQEWATIVSLIPARTDTRWWQEYVVQSSLIVFILGRVRFQLNSRYTDPAPFPSAFAVFGNGLTDVQAQHLETYGWRAK